METALKLVPDKAVADCPLCGGEWPDHKLRHHGNILANDHGHISLVGIRLTIFRAAKRPGGVTMLQLEEITGSSAESIRVAICQMNKHKLGKLGKKIVNVGESGPAGARYVLREVR